MSQAAAGLLRFSTPRDPALLAQFVQFVQLRVIDPENTYWRRGIEAAGELVVQGEDLGAWTAAQRQGWDKLSPAQQWLLGSTLGLESAGSAERP
ncbi:hypothetical protein ACWDE9_17990, partial [Streptomyces olivaceoviridis]